MCSKHDVGSVTVALTQVRADDRGRGALPRGDVALNANRLQYLLAKTATCTHNRNHHRELPRPGKARQQHNKIPIACMARGGTSSQCARGKRRQRHARARELDLASLDDKQFVSEGTQGASVGVARPSIGFGGCAGSPQVIETVCGHHTHPGWPSLKMTSSVQQKTGRLATTRLGDGPQTAAPCDYDLGRHMPAVAMYGVILSHMSLMMWSARPRNNCAPDSCVRQTLYSTPVGAAQDPVSRPNQSPAGCWREQRRDGTEQGAAHWTDRDLHDAEAVHGLKKLFGKAARQLSKELLFIVARLAI